MASEVEACPGCGGKGWVGGGRPCGLCSGKGCFPADATPAPAPTAPAQPETFVLTKEQAVHVLRSMREQIDDLIRYDAMLADPECDLSDWQKGVARANSAKGKALLAALTVPAPTPPTPTEGAQPEADEVEVLTTVFQEARWAFETCREAMDLREPERQRRALREGIIAALAWARARYGGDAAALRAYAQSVLDNRRPMPTAIRDGARAAVALTPSQAGEAVQRLVEAANALSGYDTPGPDPLRTKLHALRDAAKPFLPARGGEGDA